MSKHHVYLLNEHQVAARLGISHRSLQKWRVSGEGPAFIKLGRGAVRYHEGDLDAWVAAQRRHSTSETGADARL